MVPGIAQKQKRAVYDESLSEQNIEFDIASNPEFWKEGAAKDFMNQPWLVGVELSEKFDVKSYDVRFYRDFRRFYDVPSAEMTKCGKRQGWRPVINGERYR